MNVVRLLHNLQLRGTKALQSIAMVSNIISPQEMIGIKKILETWMINAELMNCRSYFHHYH